MATNSTQVRCPELVCAGCGGQVVEAKGYGDPSRKTVTVAPCDSLVAQGWKGHQMAVRQADRGSLQVVA